MLKRELSKLESYATLVGVMVGAGIFVAIGEAGRDTGPATFLAYLLLGPITLLTALPYVVFHSTPLGHLPGGAYIHISRTFKNYLPGFLTMWLSWLTYIGVLGVLSLSVGNYLQAFWPGIDPRLVATFCVTLFYLVNLLGVKNYGRWQSAMFVVLIISVICLVLPGLFAVRAENFQPFFVKGGGGFVKSLAILFFAYAGFDALAQTAGETKSATQTLPGVFIRGILISITIYVAISFVAFGVLPYTQLIHSTMPVAEAARSFLPLGPQIVAVGAIAAFLTTINAAMLVPSRILYVFAQDRIAPTVLAQVNRRFRTPHISLTTNVILSLFLVWTHTISYLIAITLQAMIILYATECLALALLPLVNKPLWQQVPRKLRRNWIVAGSGLACLCQIGLYAVLPNPFSKPLIIWIALGALFYSYARFRGRQAGFDYARNLFAWAPAIQPSEAGVTLRSIEARLGQIAANPESYSWEASADKIVLYPTDAAEAIATQNPSTDIPPSTEEERIKKEKADLE